MVPVVMGVWELLTTLNAFSVTWIFPSAPLSLKSCYYYQASIGTKMCDILTLTVHLIPRSGVVMKDCETMMWITSIYFYYCDAMDFVKNNYSCCEI